MNLLKSDRNFLLNIFQRIPPSHVALFLRLIRLYPTNIVDDYKDDIWPDFCRSIMYLN